MTTPEPVRSIPVPLTVRRHTEESRAIFLANLVDAMPIDMLQEDRERIAGVLLDVATAHGDELRRKRLIDRLEESARAAAQRGTHQESLCYGDWADVMRDAAEEIRSML